MTQQKVHFILVSMGTKGIAFRHQAQPGKSKSLKDSYSIFNIQYFIRNGANNGKTFSEELIFTHRKKKPAVMSSLSK